MKQRSFFRLFLTNMLWAVGVLGLIIAPIAVELVLESIGRPIIGMVSCGFVFFTEVAALFAWYNADRGNGRWK